MKLSRDKERIAPEDMDLAVRVLNRLRAGDRVFGNPAEGLKMTLKGLEGQLSGLEASRGKLDYLVDDGEIRDQIAKIKAGIKGEEGLAEWLERVAKYDERLQDVIFFASMSDPQQNSGGDQYTSDSDFVALHGQNMLILDAKRIRTSPDVPVYLDGNTLVSVGGVEILELHPATYVWQKVIERSHVGPVSVKGCVVIVNTSGAIVWKNAEWYKSDVRPVHISDLVSFMHDWLDQCDGSATRLSTLTALAKMQIRVDKGDLDLSSARKKFHI